MPKLIELIDNPDYTTANDATKSCIFEKYAASDPDYAKANDATKQLIRQKFGIGQAPGQGEKDTKTTRDLVDVPGEAANNFVSSAGKAVMGVANMVAHPINTVNTISDLGAGAILKALPNSVTDRMVQKEKERNKSITEGKGYQPFGGFFSGSEPDNSTQRVLNTADAVGQTVKHDIGSWDAIKNTLATDPVAGLGYLSMFAGGGGALAGKLGTTAGKLGATGTANALADLAKGANAVSKYTNPLTPISKFIVEPAVKYGAKGVGAVTDMLRGRKADINAANIAREAAGPRLDEIRGANEVAPDNLTAGQAAHGIDRDAYQSLAEVAASRDPDFYRVLADRNKQTAQAELNDLAQGASQAEMRTRRGEMKEDLNKITGSMRENALENANFAKDMHERIATNTASPEALAKYKEMQLKGLEESGVKPLTVEPVLARIREMMRNPKIGPSEDNIAVLGTVARNLENWSEKGTGIIDAYALNKIYSDGINETINRLLPNADAAARARHAAAILTELKPVIRKAIVDAGGTGYPAYLKTFEEGMHAINQRKLAAQTAQMYQDSPQEFLKLIRGDNPQAIENVFGPNSYDIVKEMGEHYGPLRKVAGDLQRDTTIAEQAKSGTDQLREILKRNQSSLRLPGFGNAKVYAAQRVIDELATRVNAKTMQVLSEGMRSGKTANQMMSVLPTSERSTVLKYLTQNRDVLRSKSALITNALSRSSETNNNSLND